MMLRGPHEDDQQPKLAQRGQIFIAEIIPARVVLAELSQQYSQQEKFGMRYSQGG